MPELKSCYFCGEIGESLREYSVVPEHLLSSGEERRTAVLCTTCHEKLRHIVEPLVTHLESAEASTPSSAGRESVTQSPHQEVTFDSSGSAAASPPDAEPTPSTHAGAESEADAEQQSADEAPSDESSGEEAKSSQTASEDVPEHYYKVMRLLQNREFPIAREELTSLITNAYDVTESECEQILDRAIERDVLVEEEGALHLGT